jgi:hypothetical protein
MGPNASYEIQAVARAVDIPARRLEGWVEQGLVIPTGRARGTGTRSRFTPEDVMRVAIIAEIQRLFGTTFRPGTIASAIGRDPFTLPRVDTVARLVIQRHEGHSHSKPEDTERLVVYVYQGRKGQPTLEVSRKTPEHIMKIAPVVLLIDPLRLWLRLRSRLTS